VSALANRLPALILARQSIHGPLARRTSGHDCRRCTLVGKSADRGIVWVIKDHRAASGSQMPDHAGDQGAVLLSGLSAWLTLLSPTGGGWFGVVAAADPQRCEVRSWPQTVRDLGELQSRPAAILATVSAAP
jgi:hypothetical protein